MSDITRIDTSACMCQAAIQNEVLDFTSQVGAEGRCATEQAQIILAKDDVLLTKAGSDRTRLLTTQIWCADMDTVWDGRVAAGHAPSRWEGEVVLATLRCCSEIIATAAV